MNKPISYIGTVSKGLLNDSAQRLLNAAMRSFEGQRVRVTIQKYVPQRSLEQNAYYFGVVIPAFREWFLSAGTNAGEDEIHNWIKRTVWKHTKLYIDPLGNEQVEILSSTKLTTAEWARYTDITIMYAAEHGLAIPYPREELPEEKVG